MILIQFVKCRTRIAESCKPDMTYIRDECHREKTSTGIGVSDKVKKHVRGLNDFWDNVYKENIKGTAKVDLRI